ncbi:MAG: cyclic nucleotide-binding domain-containing protein [Coriobacteriia bacterium]|nr:cyclic nucleotide-binding domain-containing protein [Coriobacteriia bacterium]
MDRKIERKQRRTFSDGDLIFKQGERGSEMYVIHSGRVRIFRTQDGHDTDLAVLGPDDFFGEMALFDDRSRSASAKAVGAAEVRVIDKAAFEGMQCDPITKHLLVTLAQRLRAMDDAFERLNVESDARREFFSTRSLQSTWLT